jgi:hypothetical protein
MRWVTIVRSHDDCGSGRLAIGGRTAGRGSRRIGPISSQRVSPSGAAGKGR